MVATTSCQTPPAAAICAVCNLSFKNSKSITRHMKRMHKDVPIRRQGRPAKAQKVQNGLTGSRPVAAAKPVASCSVPALVLSTRGSETGACHSKTLRANWSTGDSPGTPTRPVNPTTAGAVADRHSSEGEICGPTVPRVMNTPEEILSESGAEEGPERAGEPQKEFEGPTEEEEEGEKEEEKEEEKEKEEEEKEEEEKEEEEKEEEDASPKQEELGDDLEKKRDNEKKKEEEAGEEEEGGKLKRKKKTDGPERTAVGAAHARGDEPEGPDLGGSQPSRRKRRADGEFPGEQQPNSRRKKRKEAGACQGRKFQTPADFRTLEFTSSGASHPDLYEWRCRYEQARGPADLTLSQEVATRVSNFIERVTQTTLPLPLWTNSAAFEEKLDDYIEVEMERGVSRATLALRLRYVQWYSFYLLAVPAAAPGPISEGVFWVIHDAVKDMQRKVTVGLANSCLLMTTDPYPLARVHEQMAALLRKEQVEVLDPFITRRYQGATTRSEDVRFGLVLRCWLNAAMRTWSVPCRAQVDIGLHAPWSDEEKYVSKLVHASNLTYARVINMDKISGYTEHTRIPLCRTLSGYLFFYLAYCRAQPESDVVFQCAKGGVWHRASRDVKKYLTERGLPCDTIAPNHRFIHATRNIGLAVFAIRHHFDEQKIRGYSVLMRNTLETIQKRYCTWLKVTIARNAVKDLAAVGGPGLDVPPDPSEGMLDPNPGPLLPSDRVRVCLSKDMENHRGGLFFRKWEAPFYATRSVGTQTGDLSHTNELAVTPPGGVSEAAPASEMVVVTQGDALRRCSKCTGFLQVHGPHGRTRDKKMFGRFYLACRKCSVGLKNITLSHTYWFDLGVVPPQKSCSSKPRNFSEILSYVRRTTNNRAFQVSYWPETPQEENIDMQ